MKRKNLRWWLRFELKEVILDLLVLRLLPIAACFSLVILAMAVIAWIFIFRHALLGYGMPNFIEQLLKRIVN